MLTRMGHRVAEAPDGAEGVRMAAAGRFDLILMDISMPRLDGLQATDAVRAAPGPNRATPIVALTAHALPAEQDRFRAHGIYDVLVKPFSGEDLAEVIARSTQGGPVPPRPAHRARAAAQVPQTLSHLVPAFLDEGARAVADIGAMADQPGRHEALRRMVHRLAGSAGLIGAQALSRQLGRIETALKLGNTAKASAEIDSLPATWSRTVAELTVTPQAPGARTKGTA